jgi:sodium transport system permease protein
VSERIQARYLIIFWKEFREIFRDRRTLMSVVIGPLFITPALFALMGVFIQGRIEKEKTETRRIGLLGVENSPEMLAAWRQNPNLKIEVLATKQDAQQRIKNRQVDTVLEFPPNMPQLLAANQTVPIRILSDGGSESSRTASVAMREALMQYGNQLVKSRLTQMNLEESFIRPFKVEEENIPGAGGTGMLFLSQMLPYILIFAIFGGSIYAAFDQVAGEKERNTLETLLVSPASRSDIVLGKFAAVTGVCLVSSLLSILGLIIPFMSRLKAFEWLAKGGISLDATSACVVLLAIIPVSILFAGALLALSTVARNQKEAQTYLGSLFPIITIPALASIFLGTNVAKTVALVPILNASLIIKQALNGSYDTGFIALAFGTSVLYAGAALFVATRLFQKESVLLKA